MSIPPADLTTGLLVETQSVTNLAFGPSELEVEIISLFDQFRNQLLRYVLSFGLPAYEAEEVIQEVFLALFRHLQRGKSRSNLRGWIFRVAHNLALKQAHASPPARGTGVSQLRVAAHDPRTAAAKLDRESQTEVPADARG